MGRAERAVEGDYRLPTGAGLLFVFSPTVPFSAADTAEVRRWVELGGTLVYAAETGDSRLDADLGIRRLRRLAPGAARPVDGLLRGVGTLKGASLTYPLEAASDQVPLLRDSRGLVLALDFRLKSGRIVVLSDPTELTNENVYQADNWRLAADLVSRAPRGAPALFDEYHHGVISGSGSGAGWLGTAWGAALIWAALLLFSGFALRGRAFGPRLSLAPAGDRPSTEYVAAVGRLLRRAGARSLTAEVLLAATRRALAERAGLGRPGDRLEAALAQRAPALAAELQGLEATLAAAAASEVALLRAAAGLHALAYPGEGGQALSPSGPPLRSLPARREGGQR
jgi:hypothetical protein